MQILQAIRRYAHGFVNSHDFDVCRELMSEDYILRMGQDVVAGRDDAYIPAVAHQIHQFPTLSYSIHELLTDGECAAVMFSEHGTSAGEPARRASWLGVAIYRFDGRLLRECWVEQDHVSRRAQLATGRAVPVPPVALDPWREQITPNQETKAAIRRWAASLTTWPPAGIEVDPGPHQAGQPVLEDVEATIDVLVVSGTRAAFHLTIAGSYRGGLEDYPASGTHVTQYFGAFAEVEGATVRARGVTNRISVRRQLRATEPA